MFLAGYSHAFRYCPGGQQVEYREASRTPHEGALEYISVDAHKGAGEWTTVPWSALLCRGVPERDASPWLLLTSWPSPGGADSAVSV